MVICGSFSRLHHFASAHFWVNGVLYFEYFEEKLLKMNLFSFFIAIVFFMEKTNIFCLFVFFSVRNQSLACYLYVGETSSTIFNNFHAFENIDTNSVVQFSFLSSLVDLKKFNIIPKKIYLYSLLSWILLYSFDLVKLST